MSITTPVSAATPASAINPTATAIDRLYSSSHMIHTPPTRANGNDSITIAVSATVPKVRYKSSDDPERERDDDLEPRLHPLNRLVLTAPTQPVAGGELHLARHDALSVAHIAPHVPPPHIDRHLIVEVAALAPDHRWAGAEANVRDLPERHLRAATAADQEPADRGGVIPEVTGIAHLHGVALAALQGRRDLLPAERQADHLLRVAGGESIAGEGIRIRPDIQVAPPKRPLGVYARRARERCERALDILTDALDGLEVGAEDLDREGRPHTGREHVCAVLDRHRPRVHRAQQSEFLIHLGDETILRHSRPPRGLGLEIDHRLDHGHRRPVGGRVRPARLAPDRRDLRERHEDAVLHLQQTPL